MIRIEKNVGVDLLRIFSMMCICAHHILFHGNNINGFWMEYINEVVHVGGLYVFPMISGYVLYGKKFKFERIVSVWFQAVFYTVSLTILFFIFSKGTIWEGGKVAIMPLKNYTYWYLNEYIKLLLIMPVLNLIISYFAKRLNCYLLMTLVLLIPTIFDVGMYGTVSGLCLLYLVGGMLKILNFRVNKGMSFLLIVSYGILLMLILKGFVVDKVVFSLEMVCAALLFVVFSSLNINVFKNQTSYFGKNIFGVYLIHDHPLMRYLLMKVLLFESLKYSFFINLILLIMTSIIITVMCVFVDIIRQFLFSKFKLNELIKYIGFSYE